MYEERLVIKRSSSLSLSLGGVRQVPRVISVTSGKGGVGKTNIVGNLAIAHPELWKRGVVIVDADVVLQILILYFNHRIKYNISHVISSR